MVLQPEWDEFYLDWLKFVMLDEEYSSLRCTATVAVYSRTPIFSWIGPSVGMHSLLTLLMATSSTRS